MTEKPTGPRNSAKRHAAFPLPKGEGQGEGKDTFGKPRPARKLMQVSRLLRKNDTWAERLLWSWLRDRRFARYKFRRQHQFGPHILDFFCLEARLDIELDGSQHGFPEQQRRDTQRDAWLDERGIKVLRFWNSRLRREKDVIREMIWRTLQERGPHPLPEYCTKIPCAAKDPRAVPPHPDPLPRGEGEPTATQAIKSRLPAGTQV